MEHTDQADVAIERVITGFSPSNSVDRSLFGYRSRNIHAEAVDAIENLKPMWEEAETYENPIGRTDPIMDIVVKLNSIIARTMLKVGTIHDMHLRAKTVHYLDVLHSAISDLMNKHEHGHAAMHIIDQYIDALEG